MPIPPSRSDEEAVIEELRDDPEYAAEYLNLILEEGNQQELKRALWRIAQAFGGVSELDERAELSAKSLLMLSPQGNPELTSVLKSMGMRLAVVPIVHSYA